MTYLTFKNFIIYFWLCWAFVAVWGLALVVVSGGYFLAVVCWLRIVVVSLFVEHRL